MIVAWKAHPVITYLYRQNIRNLKPNTTRACLGMMYHIRHGFEHNPIGCHLDSSRQRGERCWSLDFHLDSTYLAILDHLLTKRRNQSQFIQGWRAQIIDEATNVGNGCLRLCLQLTKQGIEGRRALGK